MKMRRRVISLVKFMLMALFVISVTVLTFKLVRPLKRHLPLPSPVAQALKEPQPPPEYKKGESIDWHNYEQIRKDEKRTGPGEQGKPYKLSSEEKERADELFLVNGFNALVSDKISLHRSIPDIRNPGCKNKKYNSYLPEVSVIVPFFDEHWTTLLRTAYSVLDRSPKQLLKEIILVDDCSTKEFLKDELDDYVREYMPKVKVIHLPTRQGLILARLAGAKIAVGEVLIFLDSHCEANVNWLPPLLEPIAEDYKTCVCPFIDVIAHDTFEYRPQDEGARGAFDWELFYKRLPLLPEDLENPTEPFKSPIMAGGLFAISARFFWELGGYDEGLQIWGGEQYELSFKIWQCYGRMLDAPCSRVGHIYRAYSPFPNPGRGDFVGKNYRRVAEVWMDEYKEFLYERRPHYRSIDPGDLTEQKALRESLNCKPFSWFMKEIAFDLPKKYPPVEPEDFASGEITSVADPSKCVDTQKFGSSQRFGVRTCKSSSREDSSAEQNFRFSWSKDIRPKGRTMCWDVSNYQDKAEVTLYGCHGQGGNQLWRYRPDEMWLVHGGNPRCLDVNLKNNEIYLTKCDSASRTQMWKIGRVNLARLKDWDKEFDPSLIE